MRNRLKELKRKTGHFIEEIILLAIIAINIADFAQVLNPDLAFAKKILSWTALGYLIYRASLTNIFFGKKNRLIDATLVIGFFLMTIKNLISFAGTKITELQEKGFEYWGYFFSSKYPQEGSQIINITHPNDSINLTATEQVPITPEIATKFDGLADKIYVTPESFSGTNQVMVNLSNSISSQLIEVESKFGIHRWLNLLLEHQQAIINFTLVLGILILLGVSVYCAFYLNIRKPSIMHIIHEEGKPPKKYHKKITRAFIIFILMIMFFVAIFNLAIEWLAIAIEAPFVVAGLFFYLLFWVKHHNKFSAEGFIYRVGNIGIEFYERFMKRLKTKNGILLALAGMLVLHLITTMVTFMVPYTIGVYDSFYFEQLGPNHQPIFSAGDIFREEHASLYGGDIINTENITEKFAVTYNYLANHIAIILILFTPALVWYSIFMGRKYYHNKLFPSIFIASLVCFIMNPVFSFSRIGGEGIIGVDIQTQSLLETAAFNPLLVTLISIFAGITIYIMSRCKFFKTKMMYTSLLIILFYFFIYIFLFFIDISSYYIHTIKTLFPENITIGIIFLIFFLATIIFYLGSIIAFLYEFFIYRTRYKAQ